MSQRQQQKLEILLLDQNSASSFHGMLFSLYLFLSVCVFMNFLLMMCTFFPLYISSQVSLRRGFASDAGTYHGLLYSLIL